MQTMKLLLNVCDRIDSIYRKFIWGGANLVNKPHFLSWGKICSPKSQGGLGFTPARVLNKAIMMKLDWKLVHDREALWVKVM
ncbi:hypothetical protein AHAS_Ahas17G0210700 [Arachis hypogaea]